MPETNSPDAVVIERLLDAPVDVVWRMWTVPEHFRSWYGPTGATIPVAELDVRVGGTRHVCMEMSTPDGPMRLWFAGEHTEVVEHERLVYTEARSDEHGAVADAEGGAHDVTQVRVELTPVGDRTRMVLTHVGVPAGSPGEIGWVMALDKLGVALAS